jgi:hypothetical protein
MNSRTHQVLSFAALCLAGALACSGGDGGGGVSNATSSGGASSTSASSGGASSSSASSEAATGASAAAGAASGGASGAGTDEAYANVVAVQTSGSAGSYSFSVSVESADIGCTQYTDWWEVLSEEGELLYRRILTHSHTNENGTTDDPQSPDNTFTRSGGPVAIAADQPVIVRAHLSTIGYNGRVMSGSVDAGFVDAPDITSDFAADIEDEPPQATDCLF